jgi:SAM-dependent methyltransferase
MITYSFPRYLSAKRSVDDCALNRPVWDALAAALQSGSLGPAPRILEIGGGIGTMFQRMVEWGALSSGHYTLLDADSNNLTAAARDLPNWAARRGLAVASAAASVSPAAGSMELSAPDTRLQVDLVQADLFDFLARPPAGYCDYDLIVAHAFLDLVDIPQTLPLLCKVAKPGALFYLTINYDGLTVFEPPVDACLDEKILALYHRTMDERLVNGLPAGSSRTGRQMFGWLPAAGFDLLAAGSSDWTVYPRSGAYSDDEAYFLHHILHFVETSLRGHPELVAEPFSAWLDTRHAQVDRGELIYLAHQYDFLARCSL